MYQKGRGCFLYIQGWQQKFTSLWNTIESNFRNREKKVYLSSRKVYIQRSQPETLFCKIAGHILAASLNFFFSHKWLRYLPVTSLYTFELTSRFFEALMLLSSVFGVLIPTMERASSYLRGLNFFLKGKRKRRIKRWNSIWALASHLGLYTPLSFQKP